MAQNNLLNEKDLVLDNLNLVHYVLVKMNLRNNSNYNDYYQDGIVGLINASKHYNDSIKVSFSTFAYTCIRNEILKSIKKSRCNHISLNSKLFDGLSLIEVIEDKKINVENIIILNNTLEILNSIINTKLDEIEKKIIKMLFGINSKKYKQT